MAAAFKLNVGSTDTRVDHVGCGALTCGWVVDVVCRVGLAMRDAAEAPGSVGLGEECF